MFSEAVMIHNNLQGKDKSDFPMLCLSDYRDGFNLNNIPRTDIYLDTYDMSIHRRVMGEDYELASLEKNANTYIKPSMKYSLKKFFLMKLMLIVNFM